MTGGGGGGGREAGGVGVGGGGTGREGFSRRDAGGFKCYRPRPGVG